MRKIYNSGPKQTPWHMPRGHGYCEQSRHDSFLEWEGWTEVSQTGREIRLMPKEELGSLLGQNSNEHMKLIVFSGIKNQLSSYLSVSLEYYWRLKSFIILIIFQDSYENCVVFSKKYSFL